MTTPIAQAHITHPETLPVKDTLQVSVIYFGSCTLLLMINWLSIMITIGNIYIRKWAIPYTHGERGIVRLKTYCKNKNQGGNYTGALGDFAPGMQKRALKNKKEPLKIAIDCIYKSLFNVADLVNGM